MLVRAASDFKSAMMQRFFFALHWFFHILTPADSVSFKIQLKDERNDLESNFKQGKNLHCAMSMVAR